MSFLGLPGWVALCFVVGVLILCWGWNSSNETSDCWALCPSSTSYYPATNCVNISLGLKNSQIIVHPQFPLALLVVVSWHETRHCAPRRSWASAFHMHKNTPENFSVIVYIILSGLELTALCNFKLDVGNVFMGVGNVTKKLRGGQKPGGKAVESRQGAQIVSEMEPRQPDPILGTHTDNTLQTKNYCQLMLVLMQNNRNYCSLFSDESTETPREFATCKSTARHSPHHSLF